MFYEYRGGAEVFNQQQQPVTVMTLQATHARSRCGGENFLIKDVTNKIFLYPLTADSS